LFPPLQAAALEGPTASKADIFYFDPSYSVTLEMILALEKASASLDYLKLEDTASRVTYTDYQKFLVSDSGCFSQKVISGRIFYTPVKEITVLEGGKSFIYSDPPLPAELKQIITDDVAGYFTPREVPADLLQGLTLDGKTVTAVSLKERTPAAAMMPTFMLTFHVKYKGEPYTIIEFGLPLGLVGFDRHVKEQAAVKDNNLLLSIGLGMGAANEIQFELDKVLSYLSDLKTDIAAVDRDDIKTIWQQASSKNQALEASTISFICSNLQTQDPGLSKLVKPYKIATLNGVRTAFLSFLPSDTPAISSGSLIAATFSNPFQNDFLRDLVRTLRSKEKASVIAAVSLLEDEEYGKFLQAGGIDIVIGPKSGENTSSKRERVELSNWSVDSHDYPDLVVARDSRGLGQISLEFGPDGALRALEARPIEPDPSAEIYDEQYCASKDKLMRHFFDSDDPLLPDIRRVYSDPANRHKYNMYFEPDFYNIAAATLRRHYNAEISLVKIRPLAVSVYGDIPSSLVRSWIKQGDRLIVAKVPGRLLKSIMPQLVFDTKTGADTDRQKYSKKDYFAVSGLTKNGAVSGLQVQPEETYLAVFPESALEALNKNPNGKNIRIIKFDSYTLDSLMLDELTALRGGKVTNAGWESSIRALIDNEPGQRPLWRINLRDLALLMTDTSVRGNKNFGSVSDSRINATNQTLLQGSGKLFSEYFSGKTRFDLGVSADYGKVTVRSINQPRLVSESADELVFESEFKQELGGYKNFLGSGKYGPFANLAYDTEFTHQTHLPFRKIVRSKAGLKLFEGSSLKEFYAAFVSEQNYTNTPAKTDYAVETGFQAVLPVPGTALTLFSEGNYRDFAYARSDTFSDLKQILELHAKLSTKLYNMVMLSPFINYYMATGKLFSGTATNTTVGISIDYNYLLKLKH